MDGESMDGESVSKRLPARVAEQRLWEVCQGIAATRVLAMSHGRGQAAERIARDRPEAEVCCWYLDIVHAGLASEHCRETPGLRIECLEDWPEVEAGLVMLPISKGGEAELSRDLIQSGYQRLVEGGILAVSVDHPKDRWVLEQLHLYDRKVKVHPFDDAVVYLLTKRGPIKRVRDFSCEFAFRDRHESAVVGAGQGRLIRLVTRPGVFSHRELDGGARQLLDVVDVVPQSQILDIGCGSGAVALACAARDPSVVVHAVDSNARAVGCTRRGAVLNGLSNVTVELNGSGCYGEPERFDLALANPPYYNDLQIAVKFVEAASRSLLPGGMVIIVSKQPQWYRDHLGDWFDSVEVHESRRYHIASGIKPRRPRHPSIGGMARY